jgi:hypothetical protein
VEMALRGRNGRTLPQRFCPPSELGNPQRTRVPTFPQRRRLRLSNWTQLLNPRKSNVFTDSRPEPNVLPAPLRDAGVVTDIQPHPIPHLILRGVVGLVALARRTFPRRCQPQLLREGYLAPFRSCADLMMLCCKWPRPSPLRVRT